MYIRKTNKAFDPSAGLFHTWGKSVAHPEFQHPGDSPSPQPYRNKQLKIPPNHQRVILADWMRGRLGRPERSSTQSPSVSRVTPMKVSVSTPSMVMVVPSRQQLLKMGHCQAMKFIIAVVRKLYTKGQKQSAVTTEKDMVIRL